LFDMVPPINVGSALQRSSEPVKLRGRAAGLSPLSEWRANSLELAIEINMVR
jgi:hypothetical protein